MGNLDRTQSNIPLGKMHFNGTFFLYTNKLARKMESRLFYPGVVELLILYQEKDAMQDIRWRIPQDDVCLIEALLSV